MWIEISLNSLCTVSAVTAQCHPQLVLSFLICTLSILASWELVLSAQKATTLLNEATGVWKGNEYWHKISCCFETSSKKSFHSLRTQNAWREVIEAIDESFSYKPLFLNCWSYWRLLSLWNIKLPLVWKWRLPCLLLFGYWWEGVLLIFSILLGWIGKHFVISCGSHLSCVVQERWADPISFPYSPAGSVGKITVMLVCLRAEHAQPCILRQALSQELWIIVPWHYPL